MGGTQAVLDPYPFSTNLQAIATPSWSLMACAFLNAAAGVNLNLNRNRGQAEGQPHKQPMKKSVISGNLFATARRPGKIGHLFSIDLAHVPNQNIGNPAGGIPEPAGHSRASAKTLQAASLPAVAGGGELDAFRLERTSQRKYLIVTYALFTPDANERFVKFATRAHTAMLQNLSPGSDQFHLEAGVSCAATMVLIYKGARREGDIDLVAKNLEEEHRANFECSQAPYELMMVLATKKVDVQITKKPASLNAGTYANVLKANASNVGASNAEVSTPDALSPAISNAEISSPILSKADVYV